jgi:sarcosine oxidase subunit alpha
MRRLPQSPRKGAAITVELDGEPIPAIEGEPVACSLLAAGETVFARSVKYHRPRGPTCFESSCSNCLMRVDGAPNQFTCQVPARAGMRLERQNAFPSAKMDVFASIDWLFPKGLDHHEMFAGVPVAENVMAKVARHLAGLGLFPKTEADPRPALEVIRIPVCIVGAGAAGLAASSVLSDASVAHWVVEQDAHVGGRFSLRDPAASKDWKAGPGATVALRTQVVGLYVDAEGKFLLALTGGTRQRLVKIYARSYLLAAGGHSPLLPFENNDLPGIFTAHAAAVLLRREGLLPGSAVAIVGESDAVDETKRLCDQFGVNTVLALGTEGSRVDGGIVRAHGPTHVRGITVTVGAGSKKRVDCDAIVVAMPPSARFELARQGGARVAFSERHRGFVVEANEDGVTQVPDIFVAGDVTGPKSFEQARAQGAAAAKHVVARSEQVGAMR